MPVRAYQILVIEDDPERRALAQRTLAAMGHRVVGAGASDAIMLVDDPAFDVVIAGLDPSEGSDAVVTREPRIAQSLVCLPRPLTPSDLERALADIATRDALEAQLEGARREGSGLREGCPIIGTSRVMRELLDRVEAVAPFDASVVVTGESGTGKELVARTIHAWSPRRDRPFVAVNCAAFPETLLEAELFGHEKGAFTGALKKREGRFAAATGGTLFLDEINALSLTAQAKLLRVLADGTYTPIGTNTTHRSDVRLVSATNQPLRGLIADGRFREDFYYRIHVVGLELPPLRTREGDLPILVDHFLRLHVPEGMNTPRLTARAWAALERHTFPGNVRELEHAIRHALVVARGQEIDDTHFPAEVAPARPAALPRHGEELRPLADVMREFERDYLERAVALSDGNRTRAAERLGISRKHLWHKLGAQKKSS